MLLLCLRCIVFSLVSTSDVRPRARPGMIDDMVSEDHSHDDRSGVVIAVACACLSISTIIVAVRLYTRMCLIKQVGLDDFFAAMTLVRPVFLPLLRIIEGAYHCGSF